MKRDLDQRIANLEVDLEQRRARLQKLNAQKAADARKKDTRRKILVGAVVLTKAASDPAFNEQLRRWLDESIPEDRNRQLFDLPLRAPQRNTGGGEETGP